MKTSNKPFIRKVMSLQTCLVIVALAALVLAYVSSSGQKQRRAVRLLREHGAQVFYSNPSRGQDDRDPNPTGSWLVSLLGPDAFYSVTWIEIRNAKLNDSLAESIGACVDLQFLALDGTDISDIQMRAITRSKKLANLYLDSCTLSDAAMGYVAENQALTALSFIGSMVPSSGLKKLAQLGRLKTIDLSGTSITDDDLRSLCASWREVDQLYLNQTQITDNGLIPIGTMPSLGMLDLNRTKVTDDGLKHVANLSKLTSLSLNGNRINDDGLVHLQSMKTLFQIYLNGTDITVKGFVTIAQLPNLRFLSVKDTAVTEEALKKLGVDYPNVFTGDPADFTDFEPSGDINH